VKEDKGNDDSRIGALSAMNDFDTLGNDASLVKWPQGPKDKFGVLVP
jgi:hypothetical protein